jgi:L-ribulokinase
VENLLPERYVKAAQERGISKHAYLRELASALRVGESGLVALDWWNGNRSILDNANLSGMILGMTLQTRPEEIYRALLEATAYGSRIILEEFEKSGMTVQKILVAGGIARKDPLMMQIYADVLGRALYVADTTEAGALGSAIYAAVAAGAYASVKEAARVMASPCSTVYYPDNARREAYEALYREYRALHTYFGEGGNQVMERLRAIAAQ